MKRIFFIFLLFPILTFATEYTVPIGTIGNRLVIFIKNTRLLDIQELTVSVESSPEWITFEYQEVFIDSIPTSQKKDVEFYFDVSNGEMNRMGKVILSTKDSEDNLLAKKEISLITALNDEGSQSITSFPNPANPATMILYTLNEDGHVRIDIYNILGRCVKKLVDEDKPAGQWQIFWDGCDDRGMSVASGRYLLRLETIVNGKRVYRNKKILLNK